MDFLTAYHADRGLVKEKNQDSLCAKVARTDVGNIAMAVVCDGMGGFAKGELASATVIKAFCRWFDEELPMLVQSIFTPDVVKDSWNNVIHTQNQKILEYGRYNDIKLGTTMTAILIADDKFVVTANVGDSRIYKIRNQVTLLTEDQTVVQLELRNGRITSIQAENDPRRHILLQCVGGSEHLQPIYSCEYVEKDCMYMLCSDGFSNKISNEEIFTYLNPAYNYNELIMKQRAYDLVEISKSRMEADNISVMLMRTY